MSTGTYKPPFPYFGGKSQVAHLVWDAIGADCPNVVEPFFGSGAVLFLRPGGAGAIETINDADGFVANFWRALQRDPEAVALAADNPVNECDLHARHLWLLGQRELITDRLCGDPDFYDAKAAGWWCWGMCCWIGGGWCTGQGPWQSVDGVMTNTRATENGVWRQLPQLGDAGQGVNRKRPHLADAGKGVNRQRPHLGDAGQGVNRQLPHLGNSGQGVNRQRPQSGSLREYLQGFADRLANVRVCCGDWSRVCGPSVTFRHGMTGVFLDPPYADTAGRASDLYAVDCQQVAHRVREWAIEQGANPLMRIVLAGYDGEHEMPADWRCHEWATLGGYASQAEGGRAGTGNYAKERLWFSPACLKLKADPQRDLFEEAVA